MTNSIPDDHVALFDDDLAVLLASDKGDGNVGDVPNTIKEGWPEKEFFFTGYWLSDVLGHRRARRNRRETWIPEYRATDGECVYAASFRQYTPPPTDKIR